MAFKSPDERIPCATLGGTVDLEHLHGVLGGAETRKIPGERGSPQGPPRNAAGRQGPSESRRMPSTRLLMCSSTYQEVGGVWRSTISARSAEVRPQLA